MKILASPSSIGQIASTPFDLLEKHGISTNKIFKRIKTLNKKNIFKNSI